jgi:hypothetical protein
MVEKNDEDIVNGEGEGDGYEQNMPNYIPYYPYFVPAQHYANPDAKPEVTQQDIIRIQQQLNNHFITLSRNIDLINKQIEFLSTKVSDLHLQLKTQKDVSDHNDQKARMRPKPTFYEPPQVLNNRPPKGPANINTTKDKGSGINMIIHRADTNSAADETNPFSFLANLLNIGDQKDKKIIIEPDFSLDGKGIKNNKKKEIEKEKYESDEESEPSEYDTDDECEELDVKINNVKDLIDLGEMYDNLSKNPIIKSTKKPLNEEEEEFEEDEDTDDDNDDISASAPIPRDQPIKEISKTNNKNKTDDKDNKNNDTRSKNQKGLEDEMDQMEKLNQDVTRTIKVIQQLDQLQNTPTNAQKLSDLCDQIEKEQLNGKESNPENLISQMLDMVESTLNNQGYKDKNETMKNKPKQESKIEKEENAGPVTKARRSLYEVGGKKYSVDLAKVKDLKKPLIKLNQMVGLKDLKHSVVDMILYYLQNFETKNSSMLHTVIEGPPGVGKTQLGKILAQIYAALGIIKTSKVKFVKRTDLIGEYLGHTAQKTQKAIDEADGGVLFIDEAYSLGNEEKKDSFAKECIDTLNQNLSENKKNLICIIAGYSDELDRCFFSYNPGLRRRFPFRFKITGYDPEELRDIFINKVKERKWDLNQEELDMGRLTKFFRENKESFPYYGGDVENLFTMCKFMHSRRLFGKHPKYKRILSWDDLSHGLETYITLRKGKDNETTKDYIKLLYS